MEFYILGQNYNWYALSLIILKVKYLSFWLRVSTIYWTDTGIDITRYLSSKSVLLHWNAR